MTGAAPDPLIEWSVSDELLRLVARRRGLRSPDADDWMQDARILLIEQRQTLWFRYHGGAELEHYVRGVFEHHCADWSRRKRRRDAHWQSMDDLIAIDTRLAFLPSDPIAAKENEVAVRTAIQAMNAALCHLQNDARELVCAYLGDHVPMPLLARRVGCSLNAAHKRLRRVVASLRRQLPPPPDD